ncbi:MAG: DUF3696 domain-containing protein [Desulfurellaceae bacterium]|nr:DUF3696 domain-containing protein [Desulfurellaceae bacterium]
MKLRKLSLERYKGYAELTELELAPLTILVGANNAGKTALAKAIQLFAGGVAPSENDTLEPFPLKSGGIQHGETFEDLVTGRTVHGRLYLSATLADNGTELSLSATVTNVVAPSHPSERQISKWSLISDGQKVAVERQGFDRGALYNVCVSGRAQESRQIGWRGLIPEQPNNLADWVGASAKGLKAWASGVRHLQCPRRLIPSPFTPIEHSPTELGPNGQNTPLALAADDELRESVREWYRITFGVSLDVVAQGSYSELVVPAPARSTDVRLLQSGRGLSHVLPVVVMALTARKAGQGIDVIEHPEAELHPAAHADVAQLLLENLSPMRPMVIETHSEMMLLRTRRWIAEGRLPAENVLIYWIDTEPGHGSILRKIKINENGEMDSWPEGVFIEDYDEILAIRRASRPKE